ncbi:phage tail tape measure protein [Clostridium botulinum C/D]|uniref:phage tail tape measure protein n=1 Tax=Clostridium botulinum TaxID=1491 RepID=UPI001E5690F3|nr:phage tail tape measure protein [Clostridium botulinum]MCD3211104.1 phage tail tape measure protein [Clostridium botulinum C/D]
MARVIDAVLQLRDQFSGQLRHITQNLSNFQRQTRYVSQDLKKVSKNAEKIGSNLTKSLTMPIVGLGTLAVKASMEFGDKMAKVSTIADTTKVSIGNLQKGLLELSNQTGLSATELAEAEYQAISASVDTAKVTKFLGVATKAAKGGFTDTATSVNGLTNVLNAYGYKADKANKIANQMLITQNLGKTTFGELAKSMGKVTPIASALKMKTEELFSSMAVTTAQGLDTAESVTGLKAALSNIIKPSKEAQDASEALGISFKASEIKTKGWMPFLQDLSSKLRQASPELDRLFKKFGKNINEMSRLEKQGKKNTTTYKELKKVNKGIKQDMELLAKAGDSNVSAMATMFGSVEGLNSILMLTSETGIKKYNESIQQMKNNTTAVEDAVNKMETPGDKFRKSLNKIHNVLINLGDSLTPILQTITNCISKLANKLNSLTPVQQKNIVNFLKWAAIIGPTILVISKFGKTTSTTIKGIDNLAKSIKKAGGMFKYLSSPGHKFMIIMYAIALVAILIITHWDKVKKCFNTVSKVISKVTGISQKSVSKFLIAALTGLTSLLSFGTIFTKGFGGGFKLVSKLVKNSGKILSIAFKGIGKGALGLLKVGRVVGKGMISIISKVTAVMLANPIIAIIAAIIVVCILLYEAWKHNWGGIRDKTKAVIDFCKSKIDSIKETFNKVSQKCHEFKEKICEYWGNIKTFLAHPIQGTISLMKNGDLSGVKGKNALGTKYWGGGLSVVGEHGPEIVEMDSGAKIHDAKDSKKLFGGNGKMHVTFTGDIHVREEADIDKIATALVRKIKIAQLNMA